MAASDRPVGAGGSDRRLTDTVAALHTILQEQTGTVAGLAALPVRLSELERSLSSLTTVSHKPRLSVVAADRPHRSVSVPATVGSDQPTDSVTDTDKGAFVRRCLTDNPAIRVTDIQRRAASQGLTIAHSYISDIRKAFRAEQDKHTQQETA